MERQVLDSNIQLPPGFRFHPSDEELIVHYLRNKATSLPIPASIVAEVDLYKYNPWDLPRTEKALFGDDEWYFFSPRERKYPNGARPKRSAASGYWKATGTDKPIFTSCGFQSIGVKKALVFYEGRAPKGTKTNWTMHEYRLLDSMVKPSKQRDSMRLDDWVLCRVRQKGNSPSPPRNVWEHHQNGSASEPLMGYFPMAAEQYCSKIMDPMLVSSYLNNDCPLLACILATQDASRLETSSTTVSCFQGGNTNNSSPQKETFDVETLIVADSSSSDRFFYPLKRKPIEGFQEYENLIQTDMKLNKYYEKYKGIVQPSRNLTNIIDTEMNLYTQHHQPQHNNLINTEMSANPGIKFEELNKFTFTGGNSRYVTTKSWTEHDF